MDHNLKPFSLSRWIGVRPKALIEKLGDPKYCEPIYEVIEAIKQELGGKIETLQKQVKNRAKAAHDQFETKRLALIKKQTAEREALKAVQKRKRLTANRLRQERFSRGLSGVWDRLRGDHKRIRLQNEREAYDQAKLDQAARDALIWRHLKERQRIEIFKLRYKKRAQAITRDLTRDHRALLESQLKQGAPRRERRSPSKTRNHGPSLEPEP